MATFLEKQGFKNARNKKRRHSYTSARLFATKPPVTTTPPLTPTHSLTGLQRSGSLTGSYRSSTSSEPEDVPRTSKRSFIGFLRSKKKKNRTQSPSQLTNSLAATERKSHQDSDLDYFAGQKGEFVRVVSTVLNSKIYYKTLPITKFTTVFEVVVKLVGKYADSDDQNPSDFYLTEVKESEQGSYSRLLENSDRVYDIQTRWDDSNKCSFTLCRKDALSIEDDVFLKNPVQAMVMSPSQDYCDNGFTGVVDIDVPTTPTSPHSYNAQSSFFDGPFPLPGSRIDPFLLSVSPSELSADEIFLTAKQNTLSGNDNDLSSRVRHNTESVLSGNSNNHNNMGGQSTVDVSMLMQRSINNGMLGIMNKIVTEEKQRTKANATPRTQTTSESPRRLAGEEVILRPLVCSPMESAEKRFPEFIFTPKPQRIEDDNSTFNKVSPLALDFEEADATSRQSKIPQPATPFYKTTHTLSTVKFASTCVVYPRYHCSASLFPSFCRNTLYTTAMDMTDMLYDMLDNKSSHPSEENIFQHSPLPRDQKSSKENSIPKLNLKRCHTFHVRRDHLQLHLQDGDNMAESFHDQKVERAAQAIRQRHSVSTLRLSGGNSMPKLVRTESNSTTLSRGSTVSIGNEIATDLDELRVLKATRSRQNSHGSERSLFTPPIVLHNRTDSDGIFEVKAHGRHRVSSFGSIQTTSFDSNHFQKQYKKTSAANLTSKLSSERTDADEAHSSDDEVLYTFQNNYRPVTVLVQSKSASNIQDGSANCLAGANTSLAFRERISSEEKPNFQRKNADSWLSEL